MCGDTKSTAWPFRGTIFITNYSVHLSERVHSWLSPARSSDSKNTSNQRRLRPVTATLPERRALKVGVGITVSAAPCD